MKSSTQLKADKFKKSIYEKGYCNMSLEVKFIGYYKVRILLFVVKVLNLIVIPKRVINKKTIVIDCNFEIKTN